MFEGFYKVRFQLGDAVGRSVMHAGNGKMLGGNSAFAHIGTYEKTGDGVDIVIKTVRSKLTTADLQRLRARGTRPGRPRPAQAAFDTSTATHRPRAIEIDRTANRDGIVIVRGHELALGVVTAGSRVTLRIDGELIHATNGTHLIKTLPNPLDLENMWFPRNRGGLLYAASGSVTAVFS